MAMARVKIVPYKSGSKSAKNLSTALKALGHTVHRVDRDSPTYHNRGSHVMINWGCSGMTIPIGVRILNRPHAVGVASNKLLAFQVMQREGVSVPEFTTDTEEASNWFQDGAVILSRHKLSGHSGEGIVLSGDDISIMKDGRECPLYVKYIKKQSEYRVHVFNGQVIDIQQKRKRQETPNEEVNYQIRNHQNGWVFCRDGIEEPQGIRELAISACRSLELDFGGVDIIYNVKSNQCYVLEVNTAIGMENTTVERYSDAINQYLLGV
jgi:glutathione synthase/RimK-type ligase-like ATP-grasp enzyme